MGGGGGNRYKIAHKQDYCRYQKDRRHCGFTTTLFVWKLITNRNVSMEDYCREAVYKIVNTVVSNVICTIIFLRITFRQTWTDLFESYVCLNMSVHGNLIPMFLHICRNSV